MNKNQDNSSSFHPLSLIPHPFARVFCAVELPVEIRERATAHARHLRASVTNSHASWPRAENLHLTLKFLGEIAQSSVEALSLAADRAAQKSEPFKLIIEGAGSFPPRGAPRVLWLGVVDSSGALAQLQSHLEEECASAGFKREERPFRPHLTLARIRSPQGARALAKLHQETGFEAIGFSVTELVMMRSELGAGGSHYTEISRQKFKVEANE
ncbi:MAG: 2,3-cyclic 3-phosphodiesterase [Acidobacteriota bacterium]|jgi:2'-5' RNA ligase|nr:2,3-cyclic 3-phosphodiesterase [Acidobacteriota bacterium]